MKRILLAVSAIAIAAAATPASAANYIFDVTYNGANTYTLAPGSADPMTTTLRAGDTYTHTLSAFGDSYWNTNAGGSAGFMLALVGYFGSTNMTYRMDLLNDGTSQFFRSGSAGGCCAHLGPTDITLSSGIVFDQARIAATINTIGTPNPTVSLAPFGGAPQQAASFITFTPLAATPAVPEPATWAMMMLGFGGMGYALRRGRKAPARIRFA